MMPKPFLNFHNKSPYTMPLPLAVQSKFAMINLQNTPLKQQRGIATLLITVMMLIVLGIMALYTNRSIFIEQKTTTNTYKHALALESAQSGLEHFIGEISAADKTVGTETNYKKYFDPPAGTATEWTLKAGYDNKEKINNKGYLNAATGATTHDFLQTGLKLAKSFTLPLAKDAAGADISGQAQTYQVFLYSIAPASASDKTRFVLISQGCSDECAYAQAFVVTEFTIGESKVCPLDINGKLQTIDGPSINAYTQGHSEYNCGLSLGSTPINTGTGNTNDIKGCITDCNTSPYTPPYSVQTDPNIDNHFKKYFKEDFGTVKNKASTCKLVGNKTQADLDATALSAACGTSKTILITGDLSIAPGSFSIPYNTTLYPKGITLIVEKNLYIPEAGSTVGASVSFDGFLYVRGDSIGGTNVAGSLNINGGAAFAGDVTGKLAFAVYADPTKAKVPGLGGLTANFRSGSWRDF
ncbi:hypothetical protein K4H28_08810 [Deefgea tanakiae]|uniref:Type 4 fimbrial biogenesis protein PilX N-terminal domain-containing protein n=1 Tax=Deefgea tanakiae TaxID=2865840 RepID=A0ABX8Z1K7_9NEIS|nr:hypothetical protein [Deefgea tanakiae]QZA76449.1 hypothetical protein K4H28_08810 [Deefgea tanakiae]